MVIGGGVILDGDFEHPLLGDMSPEEFRAAGYSLIDWIARFLAEIDGYPVFPAVKPGELMSSLPATAPEQGEAMAEILRDIDTLMPFMTHWNHPRFFAYFNSSASGPGILADLLTAALSPNAMLWQSCPAATELELVTLGWLRRLLGLPEEHFGVIHDTASTSTLHAVIAAREAANDLRIRELGMAGRSDLPVLKVYCSEQTHSSFDKAVLSAGLGEASIRRVAVDERFRMRADAFEEALREDLALGARPICAVATIGTTSCTAVDPVNEIADICERYKVWLHVDAAHAGPIVMLPEMCHLFKGWERADSIVINPHKWMFIPLDLSVLYTRRREAFLRAFSFVPEYLRTEQQAENLMDYGIPLGRRFRALKLWFVLRYFGADGIKTRLREHLALARSFADWIDAQPDFERVAAVPFSTVCFRARPAGVDESTLDALNERLMHALNATGRLFLSHTRLNGKYVLRLVVSHLRTRSKDIEEAKQLLLERLKEVIKH